MFGCGLLPGGGKMPDSAQRVRIDWIDDWELHQSDSYSDNTFVSEIFTTTQFSLVNNS